MEVIVTISVSPLLSAIPCIRLIQFRKKCGLICSCANSSSICFSLSSFSCQSHILSPSIFRRFLYAKQRRIYCHYTTDSAHRGSFFHPIIDRFLLSAHSCFNILEIFKTIFLLNSHCQIEGLSPTQFFLRESDISLPVSDHRN